MEPIGRFGLGCIRAILDRRIARHPKRFRSERGPVSRDDELHGQTGAPWQFILAAIAHARMTNSRIIRTGWSLDPISAVARGDQISKAYVRYRCDWRMTHARRDIASGR